MEQKQYRTKAKMLMLNYFQEKEKETITAQDIFDYLKGQGMKTDLSTVYRNVQAFVNAGVLQKYQGSNGEKAVYQYVGTAPSCNQHLHMQCMKCGKVLHMDCSFMEEVKKHIKEHHHFMLECSNSMLYGICEECRERTKE